MSFWFEKNVLVTGGAGFIGSHLVEKLVALGANVVVVDDLSRGRIEHLKSVFPKITFIKENLSEQESLGAFEGQDVVFHLASIVGGVKKMSTNQTNSAIIPVIDRNVYEACLHHGIERLLYTSTACIYPVNLQTESHEGYFLREEDAFLNGANPESVYGWSKLYGEILGQRYHKEFGLKVAIVREFNVYGEREDFNPDTSHVIPALIRRAVEREKPFVVWGTGEQSRSFLYAKDAVEGMIIAAEKISDATPVNFGTQDRIKIKDLAQKILQIVGYEMEPKFDSSEPMGVFTRAPDISRAMTLLKWEPRTSLEKGLEQTITWYTQNMTQS